MPGLTTFPVHAGFSDSDAPECLRLSRRRFQRKGLIDKSPYFVL